MGEGTGNKYETEMFRLIVIATSTPKVPIIKEDLEENHAHAHHHSHTTHAVKKLPNINRPLTASEERAF